MTGRLRAGSAATVLVTAVLLVAAVAAPAAWAGSPARSAAPTADEGPTTTVSLTFDDGYANQLRAARMLARKGIGATFYVNSALLGSPGYLDVDELREIEEAGHEVGGHTRTHVDLVDLDDDALEREVCGDRRDLLALGLRASSFAYPYGSWDGRVVEVVQSCGYRSARIASGLRGRGTGCDDCPLAEGLDPLDHRFNVRTHQTVRSEDGWRDLAGLVRRVEEAGGGWVPLVLHRVCDGCSPESSTLDTLRRLANWLLERPGTTVVATVGDAVAAADQRAAAAAAEAAADADSGDSSGAAPGGPPANTSASAAQLVDVQVQVLLWGTLAFLVLVLVLRFGHRRSTP